MERIRSAAVAILLALALVATACSGDDGGGSGESLSPIDDLLGTGAVQDFAIHLGMWVLDDDGEPADFYEPLLGHVMPDAGDAVELAGGFTFAPIESLDARMVDPDGAELPSLSVDFGLMALGPELDEWATDILRDVAAEFELSDTEANLEGSPQPQLVEIITADYVTARTHAGLGDRSMIDVTFLDQVEPGDAVAMEYLFGQTIPGDPAAEVGLGPTELFAQRWNQGNIRVHGGSGLPRPLLDTSVRVKEGSTILSRETKREIAGLAGHAAYADTTLNTALAAEALEEELIAARETINREGDYPAVGPVEVDGPDGSEPLNIWLGQTPQGPVIIARVGGGNPFRSRADRAGGFTCVLGTCRTRDIVAIIAGFRAYSTCMNRAAELAAYNEAARLQLPNVRNLDYEPTRRVSGVPAANTVPGTTVAPDDQDPQPPPLGCGPDPDAGECPTGTPSGGSGPPILPLCNDPTGGTHGDVRFLTFDGFGYAQQAVGEFLVVESGTTVIQMRSAPVVGSDRVSIATAFAVGTGGDSVSMHQGGRIYVNGEPWVPARGERLAIGDAELIRGGLEGWTIAWPDGQLVNVFDRGEDSGLALTVRIPQGTVGVVGQLGDADGDPFNDFRTRDGRQLDHTITSIVGELADEFYDTYVDSWRISQDESLFHYAEGETTETFLIDGFPAGPVTSGDLDPDERAEAETICEAAPIVDERFFDGCVVDVALTGDPGYAYDAFRVQLVATPPPDEVTNDAEPDPVDVPAGTPGDTVLTLGGDTLIFGEDPPNQRDGGVRPTWDCEITDGNLFADGRIDLADGPRYAISVQYLASEPRFTLTVQRTVANQTSDHAWVLTNVAHFADAVDEVTLDGTRLTASGELYVNDPPQSGLAPFSQLPEGATLDRFTLDLDCGGSP